MILPSWFPTWSALALVADHLWQSTIFAAIAALLAFMLRRERAEVRYRLWLAASLKFLVPFALLVALGSHISWPWSVAAPSRTVAFIQTISQPYAQTPLDLAAATSPKVAHRAVAVVLPVVLMIAWMLGAGACLLVSLMQWRRIRAVCRHSLQVESGREHDSLRRLEHARGMTRSIPLLVSSSALEPGAFGIVRPVLLWPAAIGRYLDDAQVDAIVAHELCHIRRRDNLTASIHMLIQAIFWFYPLVWWIGARLMDEREQACDGEVIALGSAPHVYAQSILKTCEFCVESPTFCAAGVTGADLKKRIVHIMRGEVGRKLTFWRRCALGAAATAAIVLPIGIGILSGSLVRAQAADSERVSFEVASVKPNKSGERRVMIQGQPGGRFVATNVTVRQLIQTAYRLQEFQLVGAPAWIDDDHFDIVAKAAGDLPAPEALGRGASGPMQMQLMLQSLLAERFKLAVHQDARVVSIYALVLAQSDGRLGPQVRRSEVDCQAFAIAARLPGGSPPPPPPPPPQPGERPTCGLFGGLGRFAAGGTSMAQLATTLSQQVRRIVVDRTGLTGRFDFDLQWTPEQLPPRAPGTPADQPLRINGADIDPNGPSIFTAMQEQLGLKLDSTNGSVDVLVIDGVEQPTPD
jgi:bla regulator protein BlaR1